MHMFFLDSSFTVMTAAMILRDKIIFMAHPKQLNFILNSIHHMVAKNKSNWIDLFGLYAIVTSILSSLLSTVTNHNN